MNAQAVPSSDWIDLQQATLAYPVSRRTFWNWISEGRLTVYKPFRKKVLLRRSEIERLLEATRADTNLNDVVDEIFCATYGGPSNEPPRPRLG